MTRVMLVGNPNCGKTTLFNALTGENQRVGNWPGVTVEKKTGTFVVHEQTIQLIDLPGLYSLTTSQSGSSQDEKITAHAVVGEEVDLIINVMDACQLERHLYLTSQLLELGKPTIIALNMTDIADNRGVIIDAKALSERIGCPVVPMQAHQKQGIAALKEAVIKASPSTDTSGLIPPLPNPLPQGGEGISGAETVNEASFLLSFPEALLETKMSLEQQWIAEGAYSPKMAAYWANRVLEGDAIANASSLSLPDESDILMADARYNAVHQLVLAVQKKRSDASEHLTAKIDRVVLHRFWALPIFLGVMYLMFFFAK